MNYLRIFILSLLLGLSYFGIAQTADVTKGCVPLTVNFQGPGGLSNYYWDFKDGVTSNKRNPANIFNKEGTYNVTLQETPTGPVIATIQIQVYPTPVLSATTTSGCAPVNVTLKSTSVITSAITVSNYTWVFGDGNSASSGISTSTVHNYASPGTYDLSLGIQTNFPSCDQIQILSQKVTTFAPPVASFTSDPSNTITCKDTLDVKFTSTSTFSSNLSYAWNFANGKLSTSATPSSQRYFSGNYNTSLTVKSNPVLAGCISSATQAISVGRPPITIGLLKDTICIYDFAVVGTKTPGIYSWSIDPSGTVLQVDPDGDDIISTINDPNIYNLLDTVTISFSVPGYHTIILKVTTPDGQCSDVDSVKVYVDQVTASITPTGGIYTCQSPLNTSLQAVSNQNNVSYEWDISRNNPPYKGVNYLYYVGSNKIIADTIKGVNSIDYTFYSAYDSLYYTKNDQETFSIGLTVTSKVTGCYATTNKVVNMWLPNAEFRVDVSRGCAPLKVTFKDTSSVDKFPWGNSITSWKWIFDDGQEQLNSSNASIQHTYTSAGTYYARLVITTAQGCTDTSYAIPIRVGDAINSVDFVADKTSVCVGEEVHLSVVNPSPLVSGYHFVTDNNRVFHCAGDQTVSWAYDDSIGTQDVSLVMDYNGCLSKITKSDYIIVKGAVAKIDYYAICSAPMDYNFKNKSLGETSVSWDFGDGQLSSIDNVTHTYASTGDYKVTLTANSSDCPSIGDTVNIYVRKIKARMEIDSLVCNNVPYTFSALPSTDVAATCNGNYIWQFSNINSVKVHIRKPIAIPLSDGSYYFQKMDSTVTFSGNTIRPYRTIDTLSYFQFSEAGIHSVSLIVKDVNGCADTAKATFKVFDIGMVTPIIDKLDICTPTLVTFKDNSIGDTTLVSWNWNLGDGTDTIALNNNSFSHSYVDSAFNNSNYPVWLYITDKLGCKDSIYSHINYYKPVSQINASDTTLCFGDSVILGAPDYTLKGSNLSFAWDLGNGQMSARQFPAPVKYPAGDYTVKLVYTEIATGCKDSTSTVVSVQNYPVARIATNVDTIAQLCAPLQIIFYDSTQSSSGIYSRSWDFGNGHQTSDFSESWTYDKGTYKVTLIDQTSYGCADTATRVLSLARPEGNFTMDKNQICRYEEITFKMKDTIDVTSWRWSFGDGITLDNVDSVSHTYDFHPPGGSTLARLVLYKGSCANNPALEQPVYIYEVIADFTRQDDSDLDTTVCFNPDPTFRFTNTSIGFDNYAWFFGDGSGSSDYNPTHSYTSTGVYDVTLAVDNSQCKDTTVKQIIVYPNPKLKAIGDTVCVGDKLYPHVIDPDASSAYLWSPSTGLSDATSPNPEASLLHTTDFTLTETDLHGCKGDTLIKAIVIENLLSNWDTTIVIGDEIALPAYGTPIYMFVWTPNTGLSCTDCDYPKVQPLKDVTYNLTVTDVLNCFTSEYTYNVHVRPETFIKMPSAFSPNGDGSNDVLFVKGWGIKKLISFEVFNRWGQLLFTSSDVAQGWDGKFKGNVQNEDVYVYKVLATDWNEKEFYTEGYFNLLH